MRIRAGVLAAWALGLWAPPAGAQSRPQPAREYVAELAEDEADIALARFLGPHASLGQFIEGERTSSASSGPAFSGASGPGVGQDAPGQRSPRLRPDRETSLKRPLRYFASFSPTVAPFKRVTSLDALSLSADGRTPLLTVARPGRAEVKIGDGEAPLGPHDRFVGELMLDFSGGPVVPLPTVAPDNRILSLSSDSGVPLRLERDGADNYTVVAGGPVPEGLVHVRVVLSARQRYFGGAIPDAPVDVLASHVPPLPRSIRRRGRAFAAELGIDPSGRLRDALFALTAHFRAFEESEKPPANTGDVYLDLARGGVGICRHRAYAFVVTAQALSIPARFVQNEAHSFVEVELPEVGFMRIDLGGAAGGLSAEGLADRQMYAPKMPDTLPRPPAYEESYAQAAAAAEAAGHGALPGRQPGQWLPVGERSARALAAESRAGARGPVQAPRRVRRQPVTVLLERSTYRVTRGTSLSIVGRLRSAAGGPVPGLPVEVSLATATRPERLFLGEGTSGADGGFDLQVPVPADLPRGTYALHVMTPGNDRFGPATAR